MRRPGRGARGDWAVGFGVSAMTHGDPQEPLNTLGRRIEEAQRAAGSPAGQRGNQPQSQFASALAFGWRIGLELMVAVAVGTGAGWALDRWLGTRPWGMIVLFFLGVAVGMLNVWRAVTGAGMAVGFRQQQQAARTTKDGWKDEDED
jgi:ATP synthase protein I